MSAAPWQQRTLRELGADLRAGRLSPVALAEEALDRLAGQGARLNAVVTLTRERALAQARQAEAELRAGRDRGPLHGIPYGAKDLLATAGGIPTTWGFAPLRDQQFGYDAAVIERLDAAGAVLVAKLAMVELAGGMRYDQPQASLTGPGINPWHADAWSGGSSSGSGSAVGAGLVPFAIGTETHGSITGPAAMCGITGLRPTFGRVSRHGAMALAWSLDKIGPMTRSADDAGLVLAAIAGPDRRDPTTLATPWTYGDAGPARRPGSGSRPRRWRLAVLADEASSDQPAVEANFRAALDLLRSEADVSEVRLPAHPYHEMVLTVLLAEAASAFAHLTRPGGSGGRAADLAAPESRPVPYALQSIPAAAYVAALRMRQRLAPELAAWLAPFDAVVTPTLKKVAPPLSARFSRYFGAHRRLAITSVGNLLGWPCITVPNGFGERGLPTALQFVGAPGRENDLLALARHYQQQTDWHQRLPSAENPAHTAP